MMYVLISSGRNICPWKQIVKRHLQMVLSAAPFLEKDSVSVCRRTKGFPGRSHQYEGLKVLVDGLGLST